MTTNDMVEISAEELERIRSISEKSTRIYGSSKYTDEEIENIIDMRVQSKYSEWMIQVAAAELQDRIAENKERLRTEKLAFQNACAAKIKLRERALEETFGTPIPGVTVNE